MERRIIPQQVQVCQLSQNSPSVALKVLFPEKPNSPRQTGMVAHPKRGAWCPHNEDTCSVWTWADYHSLTVLSDVECMQKSALLYIL